MWTRGTMGMTHGGFAVFLWLLPAQNNHQAGDEGGVLPFAGRIFKNVFKVKCISRALKESWGWGIPGHEPWPRELGSGLISITSCSQGDSGSLLTTALLGMLQEHC